MKKLIIILVLCLFHNVAKSQIYIEGAASAGVFLSQHDIITALKEDFPYPYAYSLGVSRQFGDGPDWVVFYNRPRYGAQVMLISLGKPEDIGQIYSLQPFMRFSFLKQKYLFNPGLRLAAGIGYVSKTFDPKDANPLLNSRWNAVAAADLDLETRLWRRLYLRSSVGVMHLSDISKTSNSVNILTVNIGLVYAFRQKTECFENQNFKKKERSFVKPGRGKKMKREVQKCGL